MLKASKFRSVVICESGYRNAGAKHTFENITLIFLIKRKYELPSKTKIKISENFPVFPWCLQRFAERMP
jgi:hypothetical protein